MSQNKRYIHLNGDVYVNAFLLYTGRKDIAYTYMRKRFNRLFISIVATTWSDRSLLIFHNRKVLVASNSLL